MNTRQTRGASWAVIKNFEDPKKTPKEEGEWIYKNTSIGPKLVQVFKTENPIGWDTDGTFYGTKKDMVKSMRPNQKKMADNTKLAFDIISTAAMGMGKTAKAIKPTKDFSKIAPMVMGRIGKKPLVEPTVKTKLLKTVKK